MIRQIKDITAALHRTRPAAAPAFAGIGLLAALVVAVWGSFFAMTTMYPAYVAAFLPQEEVVVPRNLAEALGSAPNTLIVDAAMPENAPQDPVKPDVDLAESDETLIDPAKRSITEPAMSPQAMARLSFEDADTRAGASLVAPRSTPDEAQNDKGIETTHLDLTDRDMPDMPMAPRLGTGPIEDAAPETMPTAPITERQVATAQTPRPAPRPVAANAASTREAPDDQTIIASTMNASALAVPTSPRPRAMPANFRASLTARVATVEDVVPASFLADPRPTTSASASSRACGTTLARQMPRRKPGAATGQAFMASVGNGSGSNRDNAIISELARGNMPSFIRQLQPVVLKGQDSRGVGAEIVVCVTPDYLALGSDRDFVRVPLGLPAAASIASRFDMMLPTSRIVDAIYAQAATKLSPQPMQAGPQMSSTDYFLRHNATIEKQRRGRGGLVAGHKKDVVVANRMASNPGRVAIYGWHRSARDPIQPVSTVHGASYADYSHGIRLVAKTAYLNGRPVDLEDLLSSSRYAYLLNSDGPLPAPVFRIASR
ncbi:MAG TPA: hypothetical protein DEO85_13270 [Maritimibacter sp.]|nr:hypothetical protein [Maritimibacter sp.]